MSKVLNLANCDSREITEHEFLSREFQIQIKYNVNRNLYDDSSNLIITENPKNWESFFKSAPHNTLVVILIGNETYEKWKYEYLNYFKSIKKALIYNPPRKCLGRNIIKAFVANILDGGFTPTGFSGSVLRDLRTSEFTKRRMSNIEISYDYYELPQGYCNSFVSQLSRLSPQVESELNKNQSLFSEGFKEVLEPFIEKKLDFSYIGQFGNHRRATCLRVAKQEFGTEISSKSGFGGLAFDGDMTYLSKLLMTRYPLVPPGAFNNYNHRYTESLLTGGLPAILSQNSLDPSCNDNWTSCLSFPSSHSFRYLMRFLSDLSEDQFKQLHSLAFQSDEERIKKARLFLH